ncbi:hypothetical protein D3C86_1761600 [compost metagenome]
MLIPVLVLPGLVLEVELRTIFPEDLPEMQHRWESLHFLTGKMVVKKVKVSEDHLPASMQHFIQDMDWAHRPMAAVAETGKMPVVAEVPMSVQECITEKEFLFLDMPFFGTWNKQVWQLHRVPVEAVVDIPELKQTGMRPL